MPGEPLSFDAVAVERFLDTWHVAVDEYYSILSAGNEKSVERSFGRFVDLLATLDSLLQDESGPFLVGSSFSVAECIAAPWVQRFFVTLPNFRDIDFGRVLYENGFDRTASWMEAVRERPSVIESKCPDDEMLAAARRYYVSYATPGAPCMSI